MKPLISSKRPNRSSTRRLRARTATAEDLDFDPEPHMKLSRALFIVVLLHAIAVGGLFAFKSLKEQRLRETETAEVAAPREYRGGGAHGQDAPTRIHFVQRGETLSRIASLYGVSLDELMRLNEIRNPSSILAGQELVIPAPVGGAPPKLDMERLSEITTTAPARLPAVSEENALQSKPTSSAPVAVPASRPASSPTATIPRAAPSAPSASRQAPTREEEILRKQFLAARTDDPQPTATGPAPRASGRTYTVKKGDNPVTIARELGVSYNNLLKLNNISDPRKLQVGQKLQIPTD